MSSLNAYLIGVLFFSAGFNAYRTDANSRETFSEMGWYMGAEYQFYTPHRLSISGLFDYADLSPTMDKGIKDQLFQLGLSVDFSAIKNANNQFFVGGFLQMAFEGLVVSGLRTGYSRRLEFKGNRSAWFGIPTLLLHPRSVFGWNKFFCRSRKTAWRCYGNCSPKVWTAH